MDRDKRGLAFEFNVLDRAWVGDSFSFSSSLFLYFSTRRQMHRVGVGFVGDVPFSLAHLSVTAALACCLLLALALALYFFVSLFSSSNHYTHSLFSFLELGLILDLFRDGHLSAPLFFCPFILLMLGFWHLL